MDCIQLPIKIGKVWGFEERPTWTTFLSHTEFATFNSEPRMSVRAHTSSSKIEILNFQLSAVSNAFKIQCAESKVRRSSTWLLWTIYLGTPGLISRKDTIGITACSLCITRFTSFFDTYNVYEPMSRKIVHRSVMLAEIILILFVQANEMSQCKMSHETRVSECLSYHDKTIALQLVNVSYKTI